MATFGKREAAEILHPPVTEPYWRRDIHPILYVPLFVLAPIAGMILAALVLR